MGEFSVIECLIEDAHREAAYMRDYRREKRAAYESGDHSKLFQMRSPSKQRIKDDMRVIRRLTLEIERKLDSE